MPRRIPRLASWWASAAVIAITTACGGRGDDDTTAPASTPQVLTAASCAALAGGQFANSPASLKATWVDAGTKATPTASSTLPAHCVVEGTINPRKGVDGVDYGIKFQLKLPADWNQRFFFQGGGGTDGSVNPANGVINPDWDTYPDRLTLDAPWLSNSLDLSAYKARGGKVIFTHGLGDPGPTNANTVNYYNRLTQLNGGIGATQSFARLFLVPGMGHCSGGPSTDSYDPLAAIVAWVEHGTAPDTMVAKSRAGNALLSAVTPAIPANRTRPLCPYPKTATYQGSGSIDDAASFSCQ